MPSFLSTCYSQQWKYNYAIYSVLYYVFITLQYCLLYNKALCFLFLSIFKSNIIHQCLLGNGLVWCNQGAIRRIYSF